MDLIRNIVDSLNLEINISTEGHIASTPLYGPTLPLNVHIIGINDNTAKKGTYKLEIYDNKFSLTKDEKTVYHSYGEIIELCGYKLFFTKNANTKPSKITYILSILDRQVLAKDLSRVLDVRKLSDMGGIIAISILDQNASRGIDILNTLIKTFNTAGVTDKNVVGLKTVNFLNERIDTVAQELRAIEIQAERFKSANKITDQSNAGDEYLTQVMNYDNLGIAQKSELLNCLTR